MEVLACALLAAGVVAVLAARHDLVRGGVALAGAAVVLATGAVEPATARETVGHLVAPLLFVGLSVLLAEALAEAGVFRSLAGWAPRSRHVGLWALAAGTVVLLNLDAAVVLLTPLYVAIADEHGDDPVALAAQPALVACLASSALPVSNLTNLIAVEAGRADLGLFLGRLALPTLVATAVGYATWRIRFRSRLGPGRPGAGAAVDDDPGARRLGTWVVVALVVGLVPLAAIGVPHWLVAGLVLTCVCAARRTQPAWRHVPLGVLGAAVGLAVLAVAVASQVDLGRLLGSGGSPLAELRIVAVAGVAANLVNNLPAFLVGLPSVEGDQDVAALLLGVNAGPVLLVTGTLSGLLWLDAARRAGLRVGARTYLSLGVTVLPAVVAAAVVLVALP